MQEHDWEELAGFGEEEGQVVDVGKRGVAEGRGERGGYGDQEQGRDDAGCWEDGWSGFVGGFGRLEVAVAD